MPESPVDETVHDAECGCRNKEIDHQIHIVDVHLKFNKYIIKVKHKLHKHRTLQI